MNILGEINLDNMSIVTKEYASNINGASVVDFCNEIKDNYADKQVIHLILDQAGYNKAFEVRKYAFSARHTSTLFTGIQSEFKCY